MKAKNNIIKNNLTLIIIISVLILFSCKKKDSTTPMPPTPTGTLAFHLHTNIDTTEADSGVICKDVTGRQLKLNIAEFYASGIVAVKSDGSNVSMSNVYILKTIANEEYIIGTVPAGNYKSVSFNVGIDATTNQTAPSSHATSNPLSVQNPAMWFGNTTQGYIFMNVQGFADTTATNNGVVNAPFNYQLGTNAMLKTVNMPNQAFIVLANGTQYVHIICDYGKLLSSINFKTQATATPFGTGAEQATATQIANNISGMFRYE